MANKVRELFLHCPDAKPQIIQAALDEKLLDVLVRAGALDDPQTDLLVFVGESDEAWRLPDAPEDRADQHGPVDAALLIQDLDPQHQHIHCYSCSEVAVDVNFLDRTERRKFSPATTVGVVTTWACSKLGLDDAAATDCVLRICGTVEQPRPDKYLGELGQTKGCSLCFDLVKELTPQGATGGPWP